MQVLIFYAQPEPTSFIAAMKNLAVETLTAQGHSVVAGDVSSCEICHPRSAKNRIQRWLTVNIPSATHGRYNTLPSPARASMNRISSFRAR